MLNDPRFRASLEGAVELMTAWLSTPDGPPDLVLEVLELRLEDHPSGDRVVAAVELIMDMMRLCGSVLALHELETGASAERTIQDLALDLAERETGDFEEH
jgi:hypothetical protein